MKNTTKLLTLALITLFVSGFATADVKVESFESSTPTPSLYGKFVNTLTINNTDNRDYTANVTVEVSSQNCQWNSDYTPIVSSTLNGSLQDTEQQVTIRANTVETYKWGIDTGNENSGDEIIPCPGEYNMTSKADYDLDGNWEETIKQNITFFKMEVTYGDGNNVTVGQRLPWEQNLTAGESVVTNVTLEWTLGRTLKPGYMNLTFKGGGDNPIQPSWVEYCGFDNDLSRNVNEVCISGDNKTKVDLDSVTEGTINITVPETEPSGNYTGTVIFEEDPIPLPTTMSVTRDTGRPDDVGRPQQPNDNQPESPGKENEKQPGLPSAVPNFVANLMGGQGRGASLLGFSFFG